MRNSFIITILLLMMLACSCTQKSPHVLKGVEGITEGVVYKKYGVPDDTHFFNLTDNLPEYRYGLLDKFEVKKDSVVIKELKYEKNKEVIFIWLYQKEKDDQWIVASSLVIPEGIKI